MPTLRPCGLICMVSRFCPTDHARLRVSGVVAGGSEGPVVLRFASCSNGRWVQPYRHAVRERHCFCIRFGAALDAFHLYVLSTSLTLENDTTAVHWARDTDTTVTRSPTCPPHKALLYPVRKPLRFSCGPRSPWGFLQMAWIH